MFYCHSISHVNAPLSVREYLSFSTQEQTTWLRGLRDGGAVLLVTCNRVELYTFEASIPAADALWTDLLDRKYIDPAALDPYTVRLSGYEAAHHLFQVASSLQSQALGEAQILGQVANAFEQAQECGSCGHHLSMLFRAAIHAARRVHTETGLARGQVSLSSLAISHIERMEPGALAQRPILVIGAGEMGQAIIKGLAHRQASNVTLISRTYERACQVADEWHMQALPMTALKDMLVAAEIVFTTSSAPFPILTTADLLPVMELRQGRPLHILDIAVPRDVEPDAAAIPNVHLYDLDELESEVEVNRQQREAAIPEARHILEEELSHLWQDHEGQDAVPTIVQLRTHVEQIRQSELMRIYNRLPPDSPDEVRTLLEEFSHRFMNKVLHQPTHNLKVRASHDGGKLFNSMARDLFGLEDHS